MPLFYSKLKTLMLSQFHPRLIILIYAIVASFLLISSNFFNYTGWAAFGVSIIALILFCKKLITKVDIFLAMVAILSATNFVFKTNGFTLFLCAMTFFYSTGWLITKLPNDRLLQIIHFLTPGIYPSITVMATKDTLPNWNNNTDIEKPIEVVEVEAQKPKKHSRYDNLTLNIVLTVVVLLIVLPLLSYANPQFGKYLLDIINVQWIKDLWSWTMDNILSPLMILRFLVASFLYFFIPRLICHCKTCDPIELETKADLPIAIPKIAIVFTLFAFLLVQVQTTLQPELITKTVGNIANEIFFQLSLVCLVTFGLIYFNFKGKLRTKIWSLILLTQTVCLGVLAFLSDYDYVINWGLTHKRLYGFAIIAVVAGLIGIFVYFAFHNSKKMILYFALLICLVIGVTNTINLDYLIYDNPPKEAQGIEQDYVNNLSLDSGGLAKLYPQNVARLKAIGNNIAYNCSEPRWLASANNQIQYLQNKYSGARFLDWNYSEYIAHQSVKNISIYENTPNIYSDKTNPNCYSRPQFYNSFD